MEIIKSCELDINLQAEPRKTKDGSTLFTATDGELIKIYNSSVLGEYRKDLVEKLSNPSDIPYIVKPNRLVYVSEGFIGYTMDKVDGKNDIEYEEGLEGSVRNNLYRIAEKYIKLERMVKDNPNVVFPGLLNREELIVDKTGKIHLIGYDNLQIDGYKSIRRSSNLGSISDNTSKYFENGMYTKELDIRSLTLYYLELAFGIDPNSIFNTSDISRALGNEDGYKDVLKKIMLINDPKEKNEYLGNDVFAIASAYELIKDDSKTSKGTKRLVRKWME